MAQNQNQNVPQTYVSHERHNKYSAETLAENWYIELIKDMLPLYEGHRSAQKHNAMWGGSSKDKPKQGSAKTPGKRPSRPRSRRR